MKLMRKLEIRQLLPGVLTAAIYFKTRNISEEEWRNKFLSINFSLYVIASDKREKALSFSLSVSPSNSTLECIFIFLNSFSKRKKVSSYIHESCTPLIIVKRSKNDCRPFANILCSL